MTTKSRQLDPRLKNLLAHLYPGDPDEAGRRLHQKLAGFFQLNGIADPTATADEALERAAGRAAEGIDVPDIGKLCLGIARSIVREGLHHNTSESAAFLQFLEQHESSTEARIPRFTLMKTCFEKLPQSDRELLAWYFIAPAGTPRANHHAALAGRLNTTLTALNIGVAGLRRGLDDCVKELSKNYR